MKKKYSWKPGYPNRGVSAEGVGKELEHLSAASNGGLRPADVVEAARSPNSILHALFEWDDDSAAEAWRIQQARKLLGSIAIRVTVNGRKEPQNVRAFVHVSPLDDEDSSKLYMQIGDAMDDPRTAQQVIDAAMAELHGWTERYNTYRALARPVKTIKQIVRENTKRRKTA